MIHAGALVWMLTLGQATAPLCEPARAQRNVSGFEASGSSVALDPLGRGTWVVDAERDEVTLVPEVGEPRRFAVGQGPSAVVVAPDGRAFVACAGAGTVAVIDGDGNGIELPVGTEPRSLALDSLTR